MEIMAKGLFARGYDASRAEKERQDKARENMGKRLWRFFLKDDNEEASVHFLIYVSVRKTITCADTVKL